MTSCSLDNKHCVPCEGGVPVLTSQEANDFLQDCPQWRISDDGQGIIRKFEFKGFNKTMSFVNAVAWIANQEKHHPDLAVTYNSCTITFTTHAISGLSENDFICARKVDLLLDN